MPIYRAVGVNSSIQGLFKDITIEVSDQLIRCWDRGAIANCRFDIAMARDPEIPTITCTLTRVADSMPPGAFILVATTRPLRILVRSSEILMRKIENITYELMCQEQQDSIIWVKPEVVIVEILATSLPSQRKRGLRASLG